MSRLTASDAPSESDPDLVLERGSRIAHYGAAAIALHWLTALLLVTGFTLGFSMVGLPFGRQKLQWYAWHKWVGITIWLLTWGRLLWRWRNQGPSMEFMPPWQQRTAAATHALMYALLVVIPLSGWLYSSATGVQVVYLGLLPLPNLVTKDKTMADMLRGLHVTLNFTLLALVCVHAVAALKHHFVDRDAVLARMLPRSWNP
jgi:cytochrome b561